MSEFPTLEFLDDMTISVTTKIRKMKEWRRRLKEKLEKCIENDEWKIKSYDQLVETGVPVKENASWYRGHRYAFKELLEVLK